MVTILRFATLLAVALGSLSACQHTSDEVAPITVEGEWRLAASGGGITGKMNVVPAGQDTRLVLGTDHHYTRFYNGQVQETDTYEVRDVQLTPGSDQEKVLFLKSANSPNGQSYEQQRIITSLTSSRMELTTGGGGAINEVYERAEAAALLCGMR